MRNLNLIQTAHIHICMSKTNRLQKRIKNTCHCQRNDLESYQFKKNAIYFTLGTSELDLINDIPKLKEVKEIHKK